MNLNLPCRYFYLYLFDPFLCAAVWCTRVPTFPPGSSIFRYCAPMNPRSSTVRKSNRVPAVQESAHRIGGLPGGLFIYRGVHSCKNVFHLSSFLIRWPTHLYFTRWQTPAYLSHWTFFLYQCYVGYVIVESGVSCLRAFALVLFGLFWFCFRG